MTSYGLERWLISCFKKGFKSLNNSEEGRKEKQKNKYCSFCCCGFSYRCIWNNFNSGTGPCNSLAEQDLGQSIFGDKVLPVGDDSTIVQTPSNLSSGFIYADFSAAGGANFFKDEYIAVVITYLGESNGSMDEGSLITVSGQRSTYWYYGLFVHPAPGLKYYYSNCSGPSSEQGWYIDDKTPNLNYVANIAGTMPPKIEILHVGISSIEPIQELSLIHI